MNQEILKKIKSLPPMPEAVQKIQAICNNPDSSISDLIDVVEKDPSLTANLLKAANSPLYGFSREITTVSQAVSLFGMATVKGFAIASAVKSSFKMDLSPYNINAGAFVRISELHNSFMVRWFNKVDRSKLNILAPTSFLIEIGMVVLSDHIKKIGQDSKFKSELQNGVDSLVAEEAICGTSRDSVAAYIFEHWNFESLMSESIKAMGNPSEADEEVQKYAYPLKVIRTLINFNEQFTEAQIEAAKKIVKEAKLDEGLFLKSVDMISGTQTS